MRSGESMVINDILFTNNKSLRLCGDDEQKLKGGA